MVCSSIVSFLLLKALQGTDILCRCRYIVQHAINLWNEQCQYFSQQIRIIKKCNGSGILAVNFGFTSNVEGNVVIYFIFDLICLWVETDRSALIFSLFKI